MRSTGDWQKAFDLSLAAQAVMTEMEPLLCSDLGKIGQAADADASITNQALQAFACPHHSRESHACESGLP